MENYVWMQNGMEIPTAKPLYARRLSDNKEMFVVSANSDGVGVMENGAKILLKHGDCELFRK